MHPFVMPPAYLDRAMAREGRIHTCERFDPPHTALLVIDMQNYFMTAPYLGACPEAQTIVPNVNTLAQTLREAGGTVVWIQNLAPWESEHSWSVNRERYRPELVPQRWNAMQREHHGFQLWPTLDVQAVDARVTKHRYSAFVQGSSDVEHVLRDRGIDTLIITGVATNVCCESSARDAMMLNYRTLMVSDGCAASTDAEHAAALENFYLFFGDVQTTTEVCARLKIRSTETPR